MIWAPAWLVIVPLFLVDIVICHSFADILLRKRFAIMVPAVPAPRMSNLFMARVLSIRLLAKLIRFLQGFDRALVNLAFMERDLCYT